MDNETDPRCVFRCCDCQNRMFSSDHMRETQICIAKERERGRRQIEAKEQEEKKRVTKGKRREYLWRSLPLYSHEKNRYSTIYSLSWENGKVDGTTVFIYASRWHQLDCPGRDVGEDRRLQSRDHGSFLVPCCRWRVHSCISRGTESSAWELVRWCKWKVSFKIIVYVNSKGWRN